MEVLIAIPAYNCGPQIGRVLESIGPSLAGRVNQIWVIDNGSTDNTVEVALEYARSGTLPNLRVFRNRQNNNLGGTHKVAFSHAAGAGATHVVILHGDNQAMSGEVNLLLDYAESHLDCQTVLGSRFNKRSVLIGYDFKRILGNKVLNLMYSALTGRRCEDLGSGLNLFALEDLNPATYMRFANALTFNYELLLDLVGRGVNFAYVPITWREEDQVSNAHNFKVFRTAVVNLLLWRLGRGPAPADPTADYEFDEVS